MKCSVFFVNPTFPSGSFAVIGTNLIYFPTPANKSQFHPLIFAAVALLCSRLSCVLDHLQHHMTQSRFPYMKCSVLLLRWYWCTANSARSLVPRWLWFWWWRLRRSRSYEGAGRTPAAAPYNLPRNQDNHSGRPFPRPASALNYAHQIFVVVVLFRRQTPVSTTLLYLSLLFSNPARSRLRSFLFSLCSILFGRPPPLDRTVFPLAVRTGLRSRSHAGSFLSLKTALFSRYGSLALVWLLRVAYTPFDLKKQQ